MSRCESGTAERLLPWRKPSRIRTSLLSGKGPGERSDSGGEEVEKVGASTAARKHES